MRQLHRARRRRPDFAALRGDAEFQAIGYPAGAVNEKGRRRRRAHRARCFGEQL
jgi:hypothetical protein